MKKAKTKVGIGRQLLLAVQWGCTDYFELLGPRLMQECSNHSKAITLIFQDLLGAPLGQSKDKQLEDQSRGELVTWLLKNHRKQMEEFEVSNHTLGKVSWDCLSGGKEGCWPSLEGLLLWSIEQEASASVLEAIWMYMDDPVHAALVASSACRNTADQRHAFGSYIDGIASKNLNYMADRFERLAYLVVEDLANAGNGVDYLFQETSRCWESGGQKSSCFRLAHQLGCRKFVAGTFYSLAVDLYWMTPVPFSLHKKTQLDAKFLNWWNLFGLTLDPWQSKFRLAELLSIPYIKAWTHGISRLFFVGLYSYAVFHGRLTHHGLEPLEVLLFLWGLGFAQVELSQYQGKNSFREYIEDGWNFLDCMHISVMMVALVLGPILSDSSATVSNVELALETVHSLNLLPSWIRVLQLFLLSKYFGTLLMTIHGMVKDALRFFMVVSIFCFGFSCALTPVLFSQGEQREKHGLMWAFWTIVGDDSGIDQARSQVDGQRWVGLRYVTQCLLYTLALVANVLLVNLLIAVMNSTYEENQVASQTEWAFYHVNTVLEFEGEHNLPPPLNLVERFLWQYFSWSDHREEENRHLVRSKSGDVHVNRRDLKDSQQRALLAVGLEEGLGETALLQAENARLRNSLAETRARNAQLEEMAANYLMERQMGPMAPAMPSVEVMMPASSPTAAILRRSRALSTHLHLPLSRTVSKSKSPPPSRSRATLSNFVSNSLLEPRSEMSLPGIMRRSA